VLSVSAAAAAQAARGSKGAPRTLPPISRLDWRATSAHRRRSNTTRKSCVFLAQRAQRRMRNAAPGSACMRAPCGVGFLAKGFMRGGAAPQQSMWAPHDALVVCCTAAASPSWRRAGCSTALRTRLQHCAAHAAAGAGAHRAQQGARRWTGAAKCVSALPHSVVLVCEARGGRLHRCAARCGNGQVTPRAARATSGAW
jgi:hypothetical protein